MAAALRSGYGRIPRAGLAVAGVSVALHLAALAAADAWVRPTGHSWEQPAPLKDAVRITLAPLTQADAGALRRFDAVLDTTASLARNASPLLIAAGAPLQPVVLEAAPITAALDTTADAPTPEPGDAYHHLGELTKRPMLLTPVDLLVNGNAAARQPGRMRIRLLISPHGRIDEVVIDNSSLTSLLRDEVIARFANAIYEPGEIDGKPVASQVTIEIRS